MYVSKATLRTSGKYYRNMSNKNYANNNSFDYMKVTILIKSTKLSNKSVLVKILKLYF